MKKQFYKLSVLAFLLVFLPACSNDSSEVSKKEADYVMTLKLRKIDIHLECQNPSTIKELIQQFNRGIVIVEELRREGAYLSSQDRQYANMSYRLYKEAVPYMREYIASMTADTEDLDEMTKGTTERI